MHNLLILSTRFSYHFHMFPLILPGSSRGKPPLTFPRKLLLTARFWYPLPPLAVFRKTVTPFLHFWHVRAHHISVPIPRTLA
jgi:hypothetical protein